MVWMVPEEPAGGVDVWKDNSPTSTMMMISAFGGAVDSALEARAKKLRVGGCVPCARGGEN